ncbi:MAG: class I SAM-dependent methyltransferase [Ktedonobacteraceae bacterium]
MSIIQMTRKAVKVLITGISWRHPLIRIWVGAVNPFDWLWRQAKGLRYLPPYSIRVRSTGLTNQFGGERFFRLGLKVCALLREHTGLTHYSRVLELGCGSGRNALAIAKTVGNVKYVGMDIERISLAWCQKDRFLQGHGYQFDFLDVENQEYNPSGQYKASEYVFPYSEGAFDIVFLISVFTHMLTEDVKNYIGEIARVLAPSGMCMLSTFLVDLGGSSRMSQFPYKDKEHFYNNVRIPEIMVGYETGFIQREFVKHGMRLKESPIIGSWENTVEAFGQDILLFEKQ